MPTFQFYMGGKKRKQFSGGDLQQLQMIAGQFAREFKDNNVRISRESLEAFYKEHAPDKIENVDKVFEKAGGEGGGKGHKKLASALKKKYGVAPETELRYDPSAKKGDGASKKAGSRGTPPPAGAGATKAQPAQPNLHLASVQDLEKELEKRKAELEAAREESEDEESDDDEGKDDQGKEVVFELWKERSDGASEMVVIIGGGPAGLSAAVYAARAGLKPLVIAPPAGGQLQGKGVLVENYPAVTDITGPAVVFEMQKQAAKYGTVFLDEFVLSAKLSKEGRGSHHVLTTNTSEIKTHSVIIATGADSRWLGIQGEETFRGGGVSSCATCDGYLYRDKPVIVIGGGDTAMEEALHLAGTSSKVTVIHRGSSFSKASPIMAERVLNHDKIEVVWETTVQGFQGHVETSDEKANDPHLSAAGADESEPDQMILSHAVLKKNGADETYTIPCDGAFVAIGHDPNTQLFAGQLEMNTVGYLHTRYPSTATSIPGVFAAGDVADPTYRQAITSAGTGAMAALDAQRYLFENAIQDERKAAEDDFMRELMEEIQTTPQHPKDEL
jgi:thioredoxin reductase